jgi:GNAT superfamily N-acetyltransferase
VYYRFMSPMKHLSKKDLQNLTFINHRSDVALVGTLPEAHGEDIVAIGRYYLNPKTNLAEVAFVVRDNWQNRGVGSFLLKHLATLAKRNGIGGFTAEVLLDNRAMQRVFQKSDFQVSSETHTDVVSFSLKF